MTSNLSQFTYIDYTKEYKKCQDGMLHKQQPSESK
jgi:hypothetical protein